MGLVTWIAILINIILIMLFLCSALHIISTSKTFRKTIPKHKRIILINNVEQPLFVNFDEIHLFFTSNGITNDLYLDQPIEGKIISPEYLKDNKIEIYLPPPVCLGETYYGPLNSKKMNQMITKLFNSKFKQHSVYIHQTENK